MVSPGHPLLTPWGEQTIPVATPKMDDHKPFDFEAYLKLRQAQTKFFTEEGVGAVLEGSEKWYGVLNMGAIGREYAPSAIPTAFMAREDYTLLWRLLDAGGRNRGRASRFVGFGDRRDGQWHGLDGGAGGGPSARKAWCEAEANDPIRAVHRRRAGLERFESVRESA